MRSSSVLSDPSKLLVDNPVLNANTTVEGALALRDVNLSIKQGEFVCIIGDVGSGKSSLLNAIIGDLQYIDPSYLQEVGDKKLNDKEISE